MPFFLKRLLEFFCDCFLSNPKKTKKNPFITFFLEGDGTFSLLSPFFKKKAGIFGINCTFNCARQFPPHVFLFFVLPPVSGGLRFLFLRRVLREGVGKFKRILGVVEARINHHSSFFFPQYCFVFL